MTQEVRITVDANLYCRHAVGFLIDEARFEWKKRITDYIKANAFADHKFVDVKVDIIPHDSDLDYTEEDAEKHLNGEPEKKRKTYAEDFFEKFPNAPQTEGIPSADFRTIYGRDVFFKLLGCANLEEYLIKFAHYEAIRKVEDELDTNVIEFGEMPEERVWKMPMLDESEDADA